MRFRFVPFVTTTILVSFLLFACKKEYSISNPDLLPIIPGNVVTADSILFPALSPAANDVIVDVRINTDTAGKTIPSDFTGLSWEHWSLTRLNDINKNNIVLMNLVKNLGRNGVLRVGGTTSEYLYWTNGYRTAATSKLDSITKDDVQNYFEFAKAVGWKTIYTLNARSNATKSSVQEAAFILQISDSNLLAFAYGNEPDGFIDHGWQPSTYNWTNYHDAYHQLYNDIVALGKTVAFVGPDASWDTGNWVVPFSRSYMGSKMKLLTQHYYMMGPAWDPSVTLPRLLNDDPKLGQQAEAMRNAASQSRIPGYRITETNSVWGGGTKRISNTFGSALWAVDVMYDLVLRGCAGVNFHGGWFVQAPTNYSAIDFDSTTNKYYAHPIYYGMMLFNLASEGKAVPVAMSKQSAINLKTYAVIGKDSSVNIIAINKDFTKAGFITVNGVPGYSKTLVTRLNGPSMDALSGVTLGENMVNDGGNWSNVAKEKAGFYQNKTESYQVRIPAGSALLLKLMK